MVEALVFFLAIIITTLSIVWGSVVIFAWCIAAVCGFFAFMDFGDSNSWFSEHLNADIVLHRVRQQADRINQLMVEPGWNDTRKKIVRVAFSVLPELFREKRRLEKSHNDGDVILINNCHSSGSIRSDSLYQVVKQIKGWLGFLNTVEVELVSRRREKAMAILTPEGLKEEIDTRRAEVDRVEEEIRARAEEGVVRKTTPRSVASPPRQAVAGQG